MPNCLPAYLRFIRGVIDSEDLPLNISREMLQNNPQLAQIRKAVTGRVISELENLGEKEPEAFGKNLGRVRPGDQGRHLGGFRAAREIVGACRASPRRQGEKRTLKQYVDDLKPNQTDIYYLTGDSIERLKSNPKLEIRDRARHRGAAADRSGRCVLDLGAARFRRQAAEVAEPGRYRFRPDPAAG